MQPHFALIRPLSSLFRSAANRCSASVKRSLSVETSCRHLTTFACPSARCGAHRLRTYRNFADRHGSGQRKYRCRSRWRKTCRPLLALAATNAASYAGPVGRSGTQTSCQASCGSWCWLIAFKLGLFSCLTGCHLAITAFLARWLASALPRAPGPGNRAISAIRWLIRYRGAGWPQQLASLRNGKNNHRFFAPCRLLLPTPARAAREPI
jgi:hypothetical protein